MRRIRVTVTVAVGVLAAGTGIGWASGLFHGTDSAAAPSGAATAAATTPVRRGDLVETRDVAGELGYGRPSTVPARAAGTLTQVADEGMVVSRGQTLYAVDGRPVTLLFGVLPMYRPLRTGTSGVDVRQLEQNLHELGYGGFTVDDDYTTGTAAAVRDWQRDRGLARTGVVDPAAVVFAADVLRVAGHVAEAGTPVASGTGVLTVSSTRQVVTVDLDVADRRLVTQDAAVTVELPGGHTVTGHIASIGKVARSAPAGEGQSGSAKKTTIDVLVTLDSGQSTGELDQGPVKVNLESGRTVNVLSVPVAALVATGDDQYAVEVIRNGESRLVPVKIGTFANGRVQVDGVEIGEGTLVRVPSP